MPRLSDAQFSDYEYRGFHAQGDPERGARTLVVVARRGVEDRPVGSMTISQASPWENNYEQSLINRGYSDQTHTTVEEPGGQTAMAGGAFKPLHHKVSWLGFSESAPKTLLKGMMGLGVAMHGTVPVADSDLSQHGSRISQGMARKYGAKPHPKNPQMEATFAYDEMGDPHTADSEAEYQARTQATHTWQKSNYNLNEWRSFTPSQVGDITRDVEKEYLGKRRKLTSDPRVPVHPSQGKLF